MLMMLWNLKGFAEVPKDYDAQLDRCTRRTRHRRRYDHGAGGKIARPR